MRDTAIPRTGVKKDWALTPGAFRHLLAWLDEGVDSGGEKYMEMRRRLVAYFDRKNRLSPDDLADETLSRVARRLEEEGDITDTPPARYCYIVAKFVFLESLRHSERERVGLDGLPGSSLSTLGPDVLSERHEAEQRKEKLLGCLERCLRKLEPDSRELIGQYYHGEQRAKLENRRALAERLGLSMNALSIRACRIRARLEACVGKCSVGE